MSIIFPSETGDVTLRFEDVAYVPEMGFDLISQIAAHQSNVHFKPEEDEITPSLLDGRLRFPLDGESIYKLGYRIERNDIVPPSEEASPMMEVEPVVRNPLSECQWLLLYLPPATPSLSPIWMVTIPLLIRCTGIQAFFVF